MPMQLRRGAYAKRLVQIYTKLRWEYEHRQRRRTLKLKQKIRLLKIHTVSNSLTLTSLSDTTSLSLESSLKSTTDQSDTTGIQDELEWDDRILSPSSVESISRPGSDDESLSQCSSSFKSDLGYGGDEDSDLEGLDPDDNTDSEEFGGHASDLDLEEEGSDEEFVTSNRWGRLRNWVYQEIKTMYAHRYEMPRDELPHGPSYMRHVLIVVKNSRADKFHKELCITPQTFDLLVSSIEDDLVFANNSNNPQMAVEEQVAITLYRFGHDGNAASLQSITNWAGVRKGTVQLATRCVMTAVLRPGFMNRAVQFPTADEKEEAK